MLEFPVSPAQASFESAALNSGCHKSLCISVKEEQMAQGTTQSSFTKQESNHPLPDSTPPLFSPILFAFSDDFTQSPSAWC